MASQEAAKQRSAASLILACEPILDEVCSLIQAAYLGAVGLSHISEDAEIDSDDAEALAEIIRLTAAKAKKLRRTFLAEEA
jgi:hypothetical protein